MPCSEPDALFLSPRGKRVTPGLIHTRLKRWAQKSGIPAKVHPHVLRHSYASLAADLGYSEPTIAALVGHKGHTITSRYVHSADAVLLAAADAVANRTAELMLDATPEADMVPLRAGL